MTASYETVQELEQAGMPAGQAAGVARAISEQAADRRELELAETRISRDLGALSAGRRPAPRCSRPR